MKKTIIWIVIFIVLLAAVLMFDRAYKNNNDYAPADQTASADIVGCYTARIGETGKQDVYTLSVQSVSNGQVLGHLEYDNFQKDSSSGSFVGTYTDDVLLGDYSFNAEGTSSVAQVAFKKTMDGFVQGFGPITTQDNRARFTNLSEIDYSAGIVFKPSSCTATADGLPGITDQV